jgi:formate dehydrogenase major subunit
MVEIEGERTLAASCIRMPLEGMVVKTGSERAEASRNMVLELLVADQPERDKAHSQDSELWHWADELDIATSRFPRRGSPLPDISHPAMAINLDACIHCTRCVRACREIQVNDVIGMAYRGHHNKIVFDFDDPMGESTCVACGECVQSCPTGALMPATMIDAQGVGRAKPKKEVDSVCPYCGVGCQLTYQIDDNRIVAVKGKEGPSNHGRLCVKGRFGFDYINHPDRLTKPLIRRDDAPKSGDIDIDPSNPLTHFREATGDEALERAASGLKKIIDEKGGRALAGFDADCPTPTTNFVRVSGTTCSIQSRPVSPLSATSTMRSKSSSEFTSRFVGWPLVLLASVKFGFSVRFRKPRLPPGR